MTKYNIFIYMCNEHGDGRITQRTHHNITTLTQDNQYGTVIPSHIHCSTVSLTSFRTGAVPDRQSPGAVSPSPGITGLRIGRSRRADISWAPTDTRNHPTTRVLTNMSGFSPYSTAVLRVRAFTILLFYSYLNHT